MEMGEETEKCRDRLAMFRALGESEETEAPALGELPGSWGE